VKTRRALRPSDVSAVLVTRGNVDLTPILESLPFDDVVVWDNSRRGSDLAAYGRYAAIEEARHEIVYTQDDDCLVRRHDLLLRAWEDGRLVANMPAVRIDYLDTVLVGWGSLFERAAPRRAFELYGRYYPTDDEDFYRVGADFVFPMLTSSKRVDLGVEELHYARGAGRTYTEGGYLEKKRMYLEQARRVRDEQLRGEISRKPWIPSTADARWARAAAWAIFEADAARVRLSELAGRRRPR
jgi:hypothetical protein